ncbi:hypothetical protein BT96DRAFT_880179 [Gymnopus androsaceus JB14]|uniref:Uncharacterized protein n=1 Tax=Gymnopus androsaceus JB14 TaxID=1447944 RepID=A0A6A4HV41_9AGAR|nr:hypothetical protein BT96DRAFT_880179 [Gymnopus androsaceus JB14]
MSTVVQPKLEARLAAHPVSLSAIRRKPQFTYISPSSSEVRGPLNLLPSSSTVSRPNLRKSSSPSQPKSSTLTAARSTPRVPMGPPLPLYHPHGKLAMSLPPLNPSTFGLPLPITIDDDSSRSSSHSKRSGVKLRDAAVETDPIPPTSVSAVAAIAAREIKSPRKKRAGGGKRKRKDDDPDTAYPAKRNRQTRGAASLPNDEEPDSPSANASQGLDGPSIPGTPVEVPDKPERRTTRSRGAIARRDSTASETPSVSAASNVVGKDAMDVDRARDINTGVSDKKSEKRRSISKEEGEVSEESK